MDVGCVFAGDGSFRSEEPVGAEDEGVHTAVGCRDQGHLLYTHPSPLKGILCIRAKFTKNGNLSLDPFV